MSENLATCGIPWGDPAGLLESADFFCGKSSPPAGESP